MVLQTGLLPRIGFLPSLASDQIHTRTSAADRTRPAAGKPLGFFREGTMNEQLLQIIIDIAIIVLRVFAAGMAD